MRVTTLVKKKVLSQNQRLQLEVEKRVGVRQPLSPLQETRKSSYEYQEGMDITNKALLLDVTIEAEFEKEDCKNENQSKLSELRNQLSLKGDTTNNGELAVREFFASEGSKDNEEMLSEGDYAFGKYLRVKSLSKIDNCTPVESTIYLSRSTSMPALRLEVGIVISPSDDSINLYLQNTGRIGSEITEIFKKSVTPKIIIGRIVFFRSALSS